MFFIFLGFVSASLVGISLGLIGAGGSILTFPILIYAFNISPVVASSYSLVIVGFTSFVGWYSYAKHKSVDYKIALIFGLPSIVTVYLVRKFLMPIIPEYFYLGSLVISKNFSLLIVFVILMFTASISLISKNKKIVSGSSGNFSYTKGLLTIVYGFGIGVVTGTVGAGGGFLVMPTLILLAGLSIKKAVGTCLLIITAKSLAGFIGDFHNNYFDWGFILLFCICTTFGIVIGTFLSKKIDQTKLKFLFGYFELIVSIIILIKDIILKPIY